MTKLTYQFPQDWPEVKDQLRLMKESGGEYTITLEKGQKKRTGKQNNSLWKWLTIIANRFNDAGIDRVKMLQVLRKNPVVQIQNTKDSMHDEYLLPFIKVHYPDAEGSSDLSTTQIQVVYEAMNKHAGETFGISEPWPDRFNQ